VTGRRWVTAGLALLGLLIALYLTLYQLGLYGYDAVWEPLFGEGSRTVLDLTSPVPDAMAGVIAYALELALSFAGGPDRERRSPWIVLAFGVLIVTGGFVSVLLIVVQATIAEDWCTLCLASAAISFALLAVGGPEVPPALREVQARRMSARESGRR
jgi:vitamin K epoxide reductase family protein